MMTPQKIHVTWNTVLGFFEGSYVASQSCKKVSSWSSLVQKLWQGAPFARPWVI